MFILPGSIRNHYPGRYSIRKIHHQSYNGRDRDPPLAYLDSHSKLFHFHLPSRCRDLHYPARNVRVDVADSAVNCQQLPQTPTR